MKRSGRPGWPMVDTRPLRPVAVYLLVTSVGTTVAVAEAAPASDAGALPILIVAVPLAWIPAATLTVELAHRFGPARLTARAGIGAAAWAGWGTGVAASLAIESRLTIVADALAADLLVCAAAGAAFAGLGLGRTPR